MALESKEIWSEAGELDAEVLALGVDALKSRKAVVESRIRGLKSDLNSVENQLKSTNADIKDNLEKIKLNKQLPYLVGNVVEVSAATPVRPELRMLIQCCQRTSAQANAIGE